ncbi:hypothetical protein RN001_008092 [Aquatica leii]|uniref:Multidrug resistance-associated protein lethal(2)03659 n=1 Tax=Aquatica leii TaxID=1421715 RepID=A0AAN7S9F5_9COLE|nr:hypothetical protein RN001_008092 [Aquatica leii]
MDVRKKTYRKPNPIDNANILSKLAFSFVFGIFKKGLKNDFQEKDLYEINKSCEATYLGNRLQNEWNKEKKKDNPSLFWALCRIFGPLYVVTGVLYFIVSTSGSIIRPRLKGKLVSYFSPNQTLITETEAYYYGVGLVLFSMLYTLFLHYYFFINELIGFKVKTCLASVIYRKSLKLSLTSMSQKGTGDVITLITKDLNMLDYGVHMANHLWVGAIQIIILTYIMYQEIQVSSIIGTIVIMLSLPIQAYLGKNISKYRKRTAQKTDQRVRTTQEMLTALRIIKMYTWELFFKNKILSLRGKEIRDWRILSYLKTTSFGFGSLISKVSLCITIVAYTGMGNNVTAEKAFVVTGCFAILSPIATHYIPGAIITISEAIASMKRINKFLLLTEIKEDFQVQQLIGPSPTISIKKVNVKIDKYLILKNINTSIHSGLTVVTGIVGSGKSTFIKLLFGDVVGAEGTVEISGTVSYSSQDPWLFPSTIKQNIVFNEKFDEERYSNVIKACDLEKDFYVLPERDETRVIDKGLNLSRGQQMRINLARAIYKNADIYLLDDCLSAVDDHVGKHIFNHCIKKFLYDKICIFVTYKEEFISNSNDIILLKEGEIIFKGSYDMLLNFDGYKPDMMRTVTKSVVDEPKILLDKSGEEDDDFHDQYEQSKLLTQTDQNVYAEYTNEGSVNKEVYFTYFKAAGGIKIFILVLVASILAQAMFSWSDYFISKWVDIEQKMSLFRLNDSVATTEYEDLNHNRSKILTGYSFVVLGLVLLIFLKTGLFLYFFSEAAKNIHNMILNSIVNACMKFFDMNLSGNILNRFSRDMAILDEVMPMIILEVLSILIFLVSILFVISTVNAMFLIPSIILLIVLALARWLYISTSRSIRRLEGATRSPLIGQFNATLEGLSTIRASGAQEILVKEFDNHQNLYNSAVFINIAISRALGFYLDFICCIYITIIILSFLVFKIDSLAGTVGLVITQAFYLTGVLQWGVRRWAELENQMTAAERVLEYATVDTEVKIGVEPTNWPSNGKIVFKDVNLRYLSTSERVLKDINFEIQPNYKVGIVGRTGAGKTSIVSTLFRLYEFRGSIIIDDVDINMVAVELLRSSISIIPQDPILFTGTIRDNIDPFKIYDDKKLWDALEAVEMKGVIVNLNDTIKDGGSNFSIGQRQLICLARAIVRNNKVLVLDEATANMDKDTDKLIQDTIRRRFNDCTVITIAHRLHTVMNADRILVMELGRILEYEHPQVLLNDTNSHFYKMAKESGLDKPI